MEKFIRQQKRNLWIYRILYVIFISIAVGTLVLGEIGVLHSADSSNSAPLTGAYMGGAIYIIFEVLRIKKAIKNEDKLKELYVAQTDERLLMISKSTSHLTIIVTFILLLLAASVFAYINEVIYYTLFAVMVAMIAVMIICDLYFRKKF